MSATSLENKTIRPGRLVGYSYYYSNRRPVSVPKPARPARVQAHPLRRWVVLAVLVLGVMILAPLLRGGGTPAASRSSAPAVTPKLKTTSATATVDNRCAGNKLNQFIVVSIGQRHLWACHDGQSMYDTPVVTGIDYLAADKTPTGSYQIYDKQTNVTLAGSDTTGSWSDPVQYWIPFLHNQYGSYGFHDATWRDNSAFGNISPNSADASHGCVELPLASAQWLYSWAQVGTTVTIKS
ncbi:MAG TPA: L,D-transpeptidase [Candidatus Saccharimonadales bacterium]